MSDGPGSAELVVALERIRARVDERRRAGELARSVAAPADDPVDQGRSARRSARRIGAALDGLTDAPPFDRARIATTSRLPAGSVVHALVGKVVGRQVGGTLEQLQSYRDDLEAVVLVLADAYAELATQRDEHWQSALDRLAEVEELSASCRSLERRVAALEAAPGPGSPVEPT